MSWNVWSCDTVTGDKLARLPVSSFPWGRVLNGSGSGSAGVPWADPRVQRLDIDDLTAEVDRTLVLSWGETAVYGGIIVKSVYDHDSNAYDLAHADLRWILERRLAADFTVPNTAAAVQTYTNLSMGTLAKRAVQLGTTGLPNDNASLPITFPADQAATTGVRNNYGYHFKMVAELLDEYAKQAGGADVDFQPRWVNGKLNWLMRVGTVASPALNEGAYEWNMTSRKPGVLGLKVTRDASKMVNGSYAVGEGQGADVPYRSNRIVNPALPTLHRVEDFSQESDLQVLANLADSRLQTYSTPTAQWEASMLASGTPSVTDLKLGGKASFYMPKRPKIQAGWNHNRLIGFSGDLSEKIQLQFQPSGGV